IFWLNDSTAVYVAELLASLALSGALSTTRCLGPHFARSGSLIRFSLRRHGILPGRTAQIDE
ncbi:MAG TPA: hypothetical protein VFY96_05960, partial [Candidatus Binatia bacterium]|nr:hypothetical protein [Candidatus Binatia bacterium]